MKKVGKRELEQIAIMKVSLECLKLSGALQKLQDGFLNGISGKEVNDILTGSLKIIKEIAKKSNGIMEVEHKITGEITEVELELINPLTILVLALKIKTFLEGFPKVYMECNEDEVAEYIEEFLEMAYESLVEIQEQLEEKMDLDSIEE